MFEGIHSSGQAAYWLVSGQILFFLIHVFGIACFILYRGKTPGCRSFGVSAIFVLTGH